MERNRGFIQRLQNSAAVFMLAWICGGCASSETQVQKAAKDWCMTIRGCQVIPVYPLTEDIQPGDIFLVQVPVDQQQRLYKQNGFLALDNLLARLNPDGYPAFYEHNFFPNHSANDLLPGLLRPSGTNDSWAAAPHAAFPSYSFTVRNGAGLNLAVPVEGVPVGLSLLASGAASGTVQIQDAHTVGVDTLSLYRQVMEWAVANQDFLKNYGSPPDSKNRNYLRVVSRLYVTGRMTVSLKDASSRSGGVDAGVPKPVDLLNPVLPTGSTNTAEATMQNFTSGMNTLSQLVQAAGAAKDAAGNILPGGSLRLTAASSRSVSIDETFNPPLTVGYLGFDCVIGPEGGLGPPIPTHANLDASYKVTQFANFRINLTQSGDAMDEIKKNYIAADAAKQAAIRQRALDLGLTTELVAGEKFFVILNRAIDPNDPAVTKKFQALADFSSAPQP
ncbi:MAG TPA: hypothetical protein VNN22_24380 [Verrucomicrobiae bacterium]|nr:hypothetical protein [Verrucomicrobiae bacterium]